MVTAFVFILLISCYKKKTENTWIANPALIYCVENGGKLKIVDCAEGQHGICVLKDGTECGELEIFQERMLKNMLYPFIF